MLFGRKQVESPTLMSQTAESGQQYPMPNVKVRRDEPFDVNLRRFRRACEKAGVFTESRRREHYEKPTTIRKRDGAAAVKREKKRAAKQDPRRVRAY